MPCKILAVDDSPAIQRILKQLLARYDCAIFEGANGREGLEVAQKIRPDLIILDIDMPVMNGWDMLASLRFDKALRHTPVIILTADAKAEIVQRAGALDVQDLVTKPFRAKDLTDCIDRYI